ncbi:transmembrane protein, putative (macronuclear) [Tetrahymena thermophila SB210]|uniref:Transmembrane protein, putative n=1 Tax=Tetrahymena thermophila (strain SB210) TaxID=312017 RepID=W7XHK2_TETTS|nr:transmembrane protein, putative [Tetrahymena thermophila SB210]EWS73866.1 transmembrane protein, putative [Tetrahymena thermophila SB210]|eukprot:XP_012653613.1 transmembrane protein, putative [Tetrahymena thermophila SB210]
MNIQKLIAILILGVIMVSSSIYFVQKSNNVEMSQFNYQQVSSSDDCYGPGAPCSSNDQCCSGSCNQRPRSWLAQCS